MKKAIIFVAAILLTGLLALFGIVWPAKWLWLAYGAANLMMTVFAFAASKERNIDFLCLPIIFLLLHVSYGLGTIVGAVKPWSR